MTALFVCSQRKGLSTLSQKSAATVAVVSPFSATVALFCDSVEQGFSLSETPGKAEAHFPPLPSSYPVLPSRSFLSFFPSFSFFFLSPIFFPVPFSVAQCMAL